MKLYEELAGHISGLIQDGTLRSGERVPSVRDVVRERRVSRGVDTLELHRLALEQGISIAPGPIFSPRREFRNCVRLNYGHPWTPELDRAIARLGQLVRT